MKVEAQLSAEAKLQGLGNVTGMGMGSKFGPWENPYRDMG